MHNNAFTIERYAEFVRQRCCRHQLIDCVSTSPTDFHLLFSNDFYLSIRFFKDHTFFLIPEASHFPKKNVLSPFKSIKGLTLHAVTPYQHDRGFVLDFKSAQLHIQCFGRRSGIVLANQNQVLDHFKMVQPPDEVTNFDTPMVMADTPAAFKQANAFLTKDMVEELDELGFFESGKAEQVWASYKQEFKTRKLYICQSDNNIYHLSVFRNATIVDTYTDIGKAMHDYGKLFMAENRFSSLKNSLLSQTNKQIKKLNTRRTKIAKHLEKLTKGDSLKEIADVIMANLHAIPEKSSEVELFNFYTNQNITIKLKDSLSAQKNAERYYQKSKNIHIEVEHNTSLLRGIDKQLQSLEEERKAIEDCISYRELQKFDKSKTKSETQSKLNHQLPYRLYQFMGYDIWVGKSAKHNDALLKMAHKNDLWLHARGVPGSHVLLKNPSNENIPEVVLEHAASLAARYSKNQHDSLAAVIYTQPKFVRKFKGSLPGQVKVDREEVILVKPYVIER